MLKSHPYSLLKNLIKVIICVLGISIYSQVKAQNDNEINPRYHYDENNQIKKIKLKIKELKNKPVPESLNEDQKEKFKDDKDSAIDVEKDILDSLEDIEDTKIIEALHHINKPSHFDFDNSIINKTYYNGRPSSIVGLCYNPSLTFRHKSGLSVGYLMYQYPEDESMTMPIPEWDISLGYGKSVTDNFYFDINYSYSKINYGTKSSQLLLANNITISGSYDFDIFSVGSDLMVLFGGDKNTPAQEKRSTILTTYIDKEFTFNHFLGSYYFSIDPQLAIDLGSDDLFLARNKTVTENKKNTKKTTTAPAPTSSTFWGLLAVDATVSLSYRIRNFDFYFIPHYVIPYNILNENTNVREKGSSSPIFYFTTGITYRFKLWNEKLREKKRI